MDDRLKKLANSLVNYSCSIKTGQKVLISCYGKEPYPLVKEIIKEVYKASAIPFLELKTGILEREILLGATEEQLKLKAEFDISRMKKMDAYISIRGDDNIFELSDVPIEKLKMESVHYMSPLNEIRVPHTNWVVLRYPCPSMAQSAATSQESFEEFYYTVCNLDYSKMSKAMDALVDIMNSTDKVRIVGRGTDLSFSIKNIPAIKCDGKFNIPDGEVYTAPVKNSVNGVLTYNAPSEYNSFTFTDVCFTFKDGKIVDSSANNCAKLKSILDTDEGARYIGEFALGVNPYILKPMNNILFDEKIMGSFHFTPGNCYDESSNGNKSAVHWDLVCIQTPEYGGGKIYFDDVLIREDGQFVIDSLTPLNPENLK